MTVAELTASIQFVVDENGHKKAVLLDFAAWQEILSCLERVEAETLANEQQWYWSPEWQAMEREADQNLAGGEYEDFETIDDFITSL